MVRPRPSPLASSEVTGSSPGASCSDSRYSRPADLDVEHVDLAVGRAVLAVGTDVDARVRAARGALDALGDRAGDEVDAELARPSRAPRSARGRPRAAPRPRRSAPACRRTGHFSGRTTSSAPRAAAARVSRSAASRLRSRSGVELSWTAATRMASLLRRRRLTRQSITETRGYPAMPFYKDWTWVGAFGPDLMLCAATRAGRALPRGLVGGVGRGAPARALVPPRARRGSRPRARARRAGARARAGRAVGRPERPDVDAQAPGPRARDGARPGGRPARADRRVGGPPPAPHGLAVVGRRRRAGGRAAGDLEPGRRAARRRHRIGARGLDRRRPGGGPAAAVRRAARASATCASTAVATRARRENLLVVASDYEQPFGTFTGALPAGGALRAGYGVMERHSRPLVTRRSSSSSIFECIAPISSRSGPRPARTISAARSGSIVPEPLEQDRGLLRDERARAPRGSAACRRR